MGNEIIQKGIADLDRLTREVDEAREPRVIREELRGGLVDREALELQRLQSGERRLRDTACILHLSAIRETEPAKSFRQLALAERAKPRGGRGFLRPLLAAYVTR